jgi:hypothetical protein
LSSLKSSSHTKRDGDGKGRGGSSHQLRSFEASIDIAGFFFVFVVGEGMRSSDPERNRRFMGDLEMQMIDIRRSLEVYLIGISFCFNYFKSSPRFRFMANSSHSELVDFSVKDCERIITAACCSSASLPVPTELLLACVLE